MKALLNPTIGGASLFFNSDNSVTDSNGTAAGKWTAQSDARKNGLTFTSAAGAAVAVKVNYGMNANNQLTVEIPAQASIGAVPAAAIEGLIGLADSHELAYFVIENDDPFDRSATFHVYGDLVVDPATSVLSVTDGAGLKIAIKGLVENGVTALTTGQGDAGLDLIEFAAITHNPLSNGGAVDIPAEISITGLWDIHDGDIKFGVHYDSTGQTPTFAIAIAGELKGVAAGFELYSSGSTKRLLFTIKGQIKGTNSTGAWELSIGYANNVLTATGSLNDTIVTPGGSLALVGSFSVTKGGSALKLEVNLQATWKFNKGQLTVTVTGSNDSYALALAGTLKVGKDWVVSYEVSVQSGGAKTFKISVGTATPGSPLNAQLTLYFTGNKLKVVANIQVSLTYVNGMLLPGKPKPLAK